MALERPDDKHPRRGPPPGERARVRVVPGPFVVGLLGALMVAAFAVTTLTVGIAEWLAYFLLGVGFVLVTTGIMWGVARARTGSQVRWRGE